MNGERISERHARIERAIGVVFGHQRHRRDPDYLIHFRVGRRGGRMVRAEVGYSGHTFYLEPGSMGPRRSARDQIAAYIEGLTGLSIKRVNGRLRISRLKVR